MGCLQPEAGGETNRALSIRDQGAGFVMDQQAHHPGYPQFEVSMDNILAYPCFEILTCGFWPCSSSRLLHHHAFHGFLQLPGCIEELIHGHLPEIKQAMGSPYAWIFVQVKIVFTHQELHVL